MTITGIIFDGLTLAADTAFFNRGGDVIARYDHKIDKWSDRTSGTGGYAACAGKSTDAVMFIQWLNGEWGEGEEPPRLSKTFEALVSEGNKMFLYTRDLVPEPVKAPIGIGSAADDLEVLCRVGFSGPEAIKKAMTWRKDIGGEIQVVDIV